MNWTGIAALVVLVWSSVVMIVCVIGRILSDENLYALTMWDKVSLGAFACFIASILVLVIALFWSE